MKTRTDSIRAGAVLTLALLAAALVYFLVVRGDDDASTEATELPKGGEPVALAEDDLASVAESVGHDVYWAGPPEEATLEVTRTEAGNVFVRYLTEGARPGDPEPNFLTVGTYPVEDARGTLERAADEEEGAVTEETEDGALVVTNESDPTSVYMAYPESDLQIEVYAPDPDVALETATSGAIQPVS